jgi:hypothetical protein
MIVTKPGFEYSAHIDANKTPSYQIIFTKQEDFQYNLVSSENITLDNMQNFLGKNIVMIGAGIGNLPIELSEKANVLIIDKFDYSEGQELLEKIIKQNKNKTIIQRAKVLQKRINTYFNSNKIQIIQENILDVPNNYKHLESKFDAGIDRFGPLVKAKYIKKNKNLELKIRNAEEFLLKDNSKLFNFM